MRRFTNCIVERRKYLRVVIVETSSVILFSDLVYGYRLFCVLKICDVLLFEVGLFCRKSEVAFFYSVLVLVVSLIFINSYRSCLYIYI